MPFSLPLPTATLLATLVACLLAIWAGGPVIAALARFKLGQVIRTEGPQSHHAKAGTPSMGGVLIGGAGLAASLAFAPWRPELALLLGVVTAYGAIGWLDDYMIVKKRTNKGLSPRHKLAGQFLVAVAFALGLRLLGHGTALTLPVGHGTLELGIAYDLLVVFIMVGATNAVNLTDGLDGLAAGTVAVAVAALALSLYRHAPEAAWALPVAGAFLGGCLGFLWHNWHPASVFMGDTGSLGLGAVVAGLAIVGHLELWLVPVGIVFIAETLSVMAQVVYFKRTGGKRLFKMSPLHHHFELSGWKETRVVGRFYLAGVVGALVASVLF